METRDAQKSEIHAATEDASTSPTPAPDNSAAATARQTSSPPSSARSDNASTSGRDNELSPSAHIIRDDTDNGGPLVIEDPTIQIQPGSGA